MALTLKVINTTAIIKVKLNFSKTLIYGFEKYIEIFIIGLKNRQYIIKKYKSIISIFLEFFGMVSVWWIYKSKVLYAVLLRIFRFSYSGIGKDQFFLFILFLFII